MIVSGKVEGAEDTTKIDVFRTVFGVKSEGNVDPRGDPHGELKDKNVLTRIESPDAQSLVETLGLKVSKLLFKDVTSIVTF